MSSAPAGVQRLHHGNVPSQKLKWLRSPFPARTLTCTGRGRSTRLVCQAFSLPEHIDATLRNIISISAVVGISYAVLLSAVSLPPEPPSGGGGDNRKALGPGAGAASSAGRPAPAGGAAGGEDNFVWGLMGFISFLPLFNWLAWVLAAISDEDRAALYGLYAAVYGSPLLLRGLEWRDPWVLLMLALCVVHVQAERIAATEPETLRTLRPVGAVGAALRGAVGGAGALLSGLGGVIREDSRRVTRRPGGRNSTGLGDGSGSTGTGGPPQLGSGEDRLHLGEDPELMPQARQQGQPQPQGQQQQQDPRRDPSRDPELEDFSARELRRFDEMLKEKERRRRGGKGGGGGGGSRGGKSG